MSTFTRKTRARVAAAACGTLLATGLTVLVGAAPAQAHGNVNDPIARGYRCLQQYGANHLSTSYRDSDPMCWNAFQTSPNAMWNWNGMLVDGLAGNYQSISDICSAGDSARYGVLSEPGPWIATNKPAQFRLNLVDQAAHGADWIRVYISRNGFNPETQRLGWGDVVQIAETGRIPASGNGTVDPAVGGSAYALDVNASGYTGRRVLFTHWKASHADQTYYLCSDVNIGGTGGGTTTTSRTTTTTTSAPGTTTTTTTSRPATTTTTSGQQGSGSCSASYTVVGEWNSGFQADVRVTAGSSAVSSWRVGWTFADGQTVSSAWNATVTSSGSSVTATNASYNGRLNAGQSTSFGFIGAKQSANSVPALTCTAS